MNNPIYDFFEKDHQRLDQLFEEATQDIDNIDKEKYHKFRVGLLTHIKMEEKILFKVAQEKKGEPIELAKRLRLEHGALTTLVVPPPSKEIVNVIKNLLSIHNALEEGKGGMYEICEQLIVNQQDEILKQLKETTDVPVHPHNENPIALKSARASVERAGYSFEVLAVGK